MCRQKREWVSEPHAIGCDCHIAKRAVGRVDRDVF